MRPLPDPLPSGTNPYRRASVGTSSTSSHSLGSHSLGSEKWDEGELVPPISIPERIGAVILLVTTLVIGLYPRLLLDLIVPSFNSVLFEGLRKGGLF